MKTKTVRNLLILLVLMVLLAGCVTDNTPRATNIRTNNNSIVVVYEDNNGMVYRFIDAEAGVACWVLDIYQGGGLSCLPLSAVNAGLAE